MKYFLDTEFIEYPCSIELISIGIIAEDGRSYYAVSSEYNVDKANQWVKDNVIAKLGTHYARPIEQIKKDILEFIGTDKPEFWGYYADYDWVVFCWIFGTMMELPKGFPMYCRDIKQLCDSLGNPRLPEMTGEEHNALEDAKHHKRFYEFLVNLPKN